VVWRFVWDDHTNDAVTVWPRHWYKAKHMEERGENESARVRARERECVCVCVCARACEDERRKSVGDAREKLRCLGITPISHEGSRFNGGI
jgi:hypothetical protein